MRPAEAKTLGQLIERLRVYEEQLGKSAPLRVCDVRTPPSRATDGIVTLQEAPGRVLVIILEGVDS